MKPAEQLKQAALQLSAELTPDAVFSTIGQPLIILSAPRAGSTLLFELLGRQKGYWNIGGESHIAYASMPHLRFENTDKDSSCLSAHHADVETACLFRAELLYLARDHRGSAYINRRLADRPEKITLVEKTPRNSLNIPFLKSVFPQARYIFLQRDARQNIASIIEGWTLGLQTGRFATYPDLPEWDRNNWCFLLPRDWRTMRGKSLAEIAAFQWAASNREIVEQLAQLPKTRSLCINYKDLVDTPAETLNTISRFTGVHRREDVDAEIQLPMSATTTSTPDANKWKKHQAEIDALMPDLESLVSVMQEFSAAG